MPPSLTLMNQCAYSVAGHDDLAAALTAGTPPPLAVLISAEPGAALSRARDFVGRLANGEEGLVISLLTAHAPGLDHFDGHAANATIWAFTQQAALAWAPRRIRVNAIGLGASMAGPFEALEQAGRAAGPSPACLTTLEDIVRTIRFMAACPSLTGQIIRLGG